MHRSTDPEVAGFDHQANLGVRIYIYAVSIYIRVPMRVAG